MRVSGGLRWLHSRAGRAFKQAWAVINSQPTERVGGMESHRERRWSASIRPRCSQRTESHRDAIHYKFISNSFCRWGHVTFLLTGRVIVKERFPDELAYAYSCWHTLVYDYMPEIETRLASNCKPYLITEYIYNQSALFSVYWSDKYLHLMLPPNFPPEIGASTH